MAAKITKTSSQHVQPVDGSDAVSSSASETTFFFPAGINVLAAGFFATPIDSNTIVPDTKKQKAPSLWRSSGEVSAYGGVYAVPDEGSRRYLAQLNYDERLLPSFWDPAAKKRPLFFFLENEAGDILDDAGKTLFTRTDAGSYGFIEEGKNFSFTLEADGRVVLPSGKTALTLELVQISTDAYGRERVFQDAKGGVSLIQEDGALVPLQTRGKYLFGPGGRKFFRQLDDGHLYDEHDLLMLPHPRLNISRDDSHFASLFLQRYLSAIGYSETDRSTKKAHHVSFNLEQAKHYAVTDEIGCTRFDYTASEALRHTHHGQTLYFRYALGGTNLSRERTELLVTNGIDDTATRPVIMVDLDWLRRLPAEQEKPLVRHIKKLFPNYRVEYYTAHLLERTAHLRRYQKKQGLPDGALHVGDEGGQMYNRFEGQTGDARIRYLSDALTQGLLRGVPYAAVLTDKKTGTVLWEQMGIPVFWQGKTDFVAGRLLLAEVGKDPNGAAALPLREFADKVRAAQTLRGAEKLAWDLSFAIGGRERVHEGAQITLMTSGSAAKAAEFTRIEALGTGDVWASQIYEMQNDAFSEDLTAAFSQSLDNGADVLMTQDFAGAYLVGNEKGRMRHALKQADKTASGNFSHSWHPFFGDAGPLHIDHRKRAVILDTREWRAPNGERLQVPVAYTKISGRNWTSENHGDPRPDLGAQDYDRRQSPYYDATAWIYDQDFAEENLVDILAAFRLNAPRQVPNVELVGSFLAPNLDAELHQQLFSDFDFRIYQQQAAQLECRYFDPLRAGKSVSWEGLTYDAVEALAKAQWLYYDALVKTAPATLTFADWVLWHIAQNVLIEAAFAFDAVEYQKIYQEAIASTSELPIGERTHAAAIATEKARQSGDWRLAALAEAAAFVSDNADAVRAWQVGLANDPALVGDGDAQLGFLLEDFDRRYRLHRQLLEELSVAEQERALTKVLSRPIHTLGADELAERKAALAVCFAQAATIARELLATRPVDGRYDYWNAHFLTKTAIAEFWLNERDFLRPKAAELAYKAVAEEFLHGKKVSLNGKSHGARNPYDFQVEDPDGVTTADQTRRGAFATSYRATLGRLLEAELSLEFARDASYVSLRDGSELADTLIAEGALLDDDEAVATLLAALEFKSKKYSPHKNKPMERDARNLSFDDVSLTSINHQGAWKYDLRNREAFLRRVFEPSEDKFIATIEYPLKDEQIGWLERAKEQLPNKRFVIVIGPLMPSLDRIRIHGIKRLLAAGIEVWFTPNQRMHAKLWNGNIGSDNSADDFSEKNNEVTVNTADATFVRVIQDEHFSDVLMERAVPLHLLDPAIINEVLGFPDDMLFKKGKGFLSLFE